MRSTPSSINRIASVSVASSGSYSMVSRLSPVISATIIAAAELRVARSAIRNISTALATPIIVKYRDEQTDARTALEEGLR